MKRIFIRELLENETAITAIDGDKVKTAIFHQLDSDSDVLLDFTHIRTVTNAFLCRVFEELVSSSFINKVQIDQKTLSPLLLERINMVKKTIECPLDMDNIDTDDWWDIETE